MPVIELAGGPLDGLIFRMEEPPTGIMQVPMIQRSFCDHLLFWDVPRRGEREQKHEDYERAIGPVFRHKDLS